MVDGPCIKLLLDSGAKSGCLSSNRVCACVCWNPIKVRGAGMRSFSLTVIDCLTDSLYTSYLPNLVALGRRRA